MVDGSHAAGPVKKRKRANLIMLSSTDGPAPAVAPTPSIASIMRPEPLEGGGAFAALQAAHGLHSQVAGAEHGEGCWATDSEGLWEVWLQSCDDGGCTLRGLKQGTAIWERVVASPVQRLAVDGGFAVVVAGSELHVLQLCDGRAALPPLVLGAAPVLVKLTPQGHLLAVCRDAVVSVWDLRACRCCVQASLVAHCVPADIEALGVKPKTGEPYVKLRGGRVLLFHKELRSWMTLTCLQLEPGQFEAQEAMGAPQKRPADAVRVESDLLVAACIGDPDLFMVHLEALCWFFAVVDLRALRCWLAAILNVALGASKPWPLLTSELGKMEVGGGLLLREVILPVLRRVPTAQDLRAELEAVASGADALPSL